MKKILATIFICVLLFAIAHGQTISKKDARELLVKAWSYLKTSDTTSFADLWLLDNSHWPYHDKAFTKTDVTDNFNFMKEFLDTALTQHLNIDYIEIEKYNLKDFDKKYNEEPTDEKYWIKAWFKYNEHYYKGFGFYLTYKNDKWLVRYNPSTSTLRRP